MMPQPFHLPSFEEEARVIVEMARRKARDLLVAAMAEGKTIREEARRGGWEAGAAEGRAQAIESERERVRAETAEIATLLSELGKGIQEKRRELEDQAERELVRLSIDIAAKVIKAEVSTDRCVAAGNLRRAIELVVRKNILEVRVHPEDHSALEQYLPELTGQFAEIESLELRSDPDVSRGGCVVVTPQGKIDADLRTQLEEIDRVLLG